MPQSRQVSGLSAEERGGEVAGSWRQRVRLVVVIPAARRDDVLDTVRSVLAHAVGDLGIVVLDDSRGRGPDLQTLRGLSPAVRVLTAPAAAPGTRGGLWAKVAYGVRHALRHFDFEVLLRLDADALMIGSGGDLHAIERFRAAPEVGMLGSFRVGWDGRPRDARPAARILALAMGRRGFLDPDCRRLLRDLVENATASGYSLGDHALGSATFVSRAAVDALDTRGWLVAPELARSSIPDDHLLSLLVAAAGYQIGDFGRPGDPLALSWRGLPAAPEKLLDAGVSIVHSVRSYADLDEAAIRGLFARHRGELVDEVG